MKFAGKWIQLETITLSEVTQSKKVMNVCNHLQINITHKVMDIHITFHRHKMLNKKEGLNIHGVVLHRTGNETVIESRWERTG